MPLFHCRKCMHEWEGIAGSDTCDWCKTGNAIILQDKTDFETFCDQVIGECGPIDVIVSKKKNK